MPIKLHRCMLNAFARKLFYFKRVHGLIFLFSCLQFQTGLAQAEIIDSLKNALPSLKDTSRIDCLNELSFQYIRLLIRDSAKHFESVAYKESEKINYIHGIAECISNQSGIVEYFDNDLGKSETLANQSINLFKKTSNKKGIEKAYDNLSFAVFGESKYDEAYQIQVRKYENSRINKNAFGMWDALTGMGVIHFQEGNYDSAFYFTQEAQQIAIVNKNDVWISDDLIAFGTLYRAIGDYRNALNNYRQVFLTDTKETIQSRVDGSYETWARMEFAELFSLEHQYDSAWHYYNLFDTIKITEKDLRIYLVSTGETYLLQKNYKKALPNFLRGLAIHKKLNDRNEIKRVLLDVAKTYLALNDYKQALSYAKEGLDLSLQTKSLQFVRDAYQDLYLLYDQVHKTDSAYYYYQKCTAVKDEVVNDQIKGMFAAYKYQEEINHINNE
jgi:tetratricopeptide (TPR) repeat protein